MTKTIKTIPKLRFPEFRDAPEWEEKPLGKCLLRHPDYGVNAAAVPFSENLPKYLRITDISENGYYLSEGRVSVNIEATSDNYLDEGDIVLARTGASVGKSYKYKKEDGALVFAGFLIRVKPDKTKLNSDLLFNFFSTEKYWKWVGVTSARSGQPGINGNEYASLAIPIPPTLEEQQKIANCLSSVDELITAQSAKVEALKAHKKAMMQQLFPAEGETTPRLRFPEFRDAPEWEEKEVDKLIFIVTPPRKLLTSQYFYKGKFPIIDQSQNYITGWTDDTEAIINSFLPLIVFGDHTCVLKIVRKPFAQGADGIKIFYANPELLSTDYLYQFLQFEPVKMEEYKRHFSILKIKKIKFPDKKSGEQQKIADCLSSIDKLITAQSAKVEALKAHKKALMQQLFPKQKGA